LKRGERQADRFPFMPAYRHEVTGLKTYRGPKRKEQFGVWFHTRPLVTHTFLAHRRGNAN
jgi:hypothetical protein